MRFDCTPYYHVGEQYAWDTLMDEMHQEVRLIDQGGFTGLWPRRAPLRMGWLVPGLSQPHPYGRGPDKEQ